MYDVSVMNKIKQRDAYMVWGMLYKIFSRAISRVRKECKCEKSKECGKTELFGGLSSMPTLPGERCDSELVSIITSTSFNKMQTTIFI